MKTIWFFSKIFGLFLILIGLNLHISMNLTIPVQAANTSYNMKDNDYLLYQVNVTGVLLNGYRVKLGTTGPGQLAETTDTNLRLVFHRDSSISKNFEVTLSYSLVGSGYYTLTEEVINISYDFDLTLKGNTQNNLYYYLNGSEWGYLPFYVPQISLENDINISGTTQYPNEVAIANSYPAGGLTTISSPGGSQTVIHLAVTNKVSILGSSFDSKPYNIDADTGILLETSGGDPFWFLFSRESRPMEAGHLVLAETNIDLGPEYQPPIMEFLSNWGLILFSVIVIGGLGGFYVLKLKKRKK